jgi:hypothetical protein
MEPKLKIVAFAMTGQAESRQRPPHRSGGRGKDVPAKHASGRDTAGRRAAEPAKRTPPLRFVASGVKTVRFRLGALEDFSYVAW